MPDYYAHSKEGRPPSEWRPLEEHLKNVAEMARGDLPIPSGQAIGAIWPGCARFWKACLPFGYNYSRY